jgi:ribosomal protein S27AE
VKTRRPIRPDVAARIVSQAAASLGIEAGLIFTRDRHEKVALARKVAMILLAEQGGHDEVARIFQRERTTIAYARASTPTEVVERVRRGEPVVIQSADQVKSGVARRQRKCACGNVAGDHFFNGWVCGRCHEIESNLYKNEMLAK